MLANSGVVFAEQIKIITHQDRAVSKTELRSIFTMRRRNWSDGKPIKVFVFPDSSHVHQRFAKQNLGIFPHRLRKTWDRLVFTGTGQSPVEIETTEQMKSRVKSTPGAIGYFLEETKDGSTTPNTQEDSTQ